MTGPVGLARATCQTWPQMSHRKYWTAAFGLMPSSGRGVDRWHCGHGRSGIMGKCRLYVQLRKRAVQSGTALTRSVVARATGTIGDSSLQTERLEPRVCSQKERDKRGERGHALVRISSLHVRARHASSAATLAGVCHTAH